MSVRRLLAYAAPAFPLGLPTIPAFVLLPAFYADEVGLGLAVTGWVLLLARLLDMVTDPLIGALSDRTPGGFGRRKPWIFMGGLIGALGIVNLFAPPEGAGAAHLIIWSAVLYLGWTMVAVPYTAWGAEISDDYHERSRIAGAREAAMILGVLAAGAVPAAALAAGWSQSEGLALVAWLAVGVGALTFLALLLVVPEPGRPKTDRTFPSVRASLRALAANGPFVRLLAAWVVNGLSVGVAAALFPLYVQYVLGVGDTLRGALIFLYFLAGVLAVPVWLRLSRRLGKHRVWCLAMLMACAAFIWIPALGNGDVAVFVVICVVTGFALGADLALPPAMQADVIDLDTLRHRVRRAGVFFALWSMGTKFALALAVGTAFPALSFFGFETGEEAGNSEEGLLALALIYGWATVVLKAVAIALVWRHPIGARQQRAIRSRIDARARRPSLTGVSSA